MTGTMPVIDSVKQDSLTALAALILLTTASISFSHIYLVQINLDRTSQARKNMTV
jgi:hypothetical protein